MITTPTYKFKKRQLIDVPNIEVGEDNWDTVETELLKKIDKTQIKSTLTETVNGNVLDATQGKILNDKINTKADSSHTHSNYVNQNAFSNIKVGTNIVSADNATDTVELVAGDNITLTTNATNDSVTIVARDTVYTHPNDSSTRHVTDTQISTWTAKETTSGSQAKADKALLEAKTYTDTKIASLVDTAPETLDTLNELAQALGNDPNFATTVTNQIGTKVDKIAGMGLSTNDYTTAEKTKLSSISNGAEVNQNAFANVKVGATTIIADSKSDTIELIAGSNVTITPDATLDKVTISATDTVYTHPNSHPSTMITGLHTVATSGNYNDLQNKPKTLPPSPHNHSYNDLTDVPSTFPPSPHNHREQSFDRVYKSLEEIDPSFTTSTPLKDVILSMVNYSTATYSIGSDIGIYPANYSMVQIFKHGNDRNIVHLYNTNGKLQYTSSYHTSANPTSTWYKVGDGGNADTVDGKHATDFASSTGFNDNFGVGKYLNFNSYGGSTHGEGTSKAYYKAIDQSWRTTFLDIYLGNNRIYHTGNKPTKADIGLGNVPNYGASTSVTSSSTTTLATSSAVKQAYDKGVEALNLVQASNRMYKPSNTVRQTLDSGVLNYGTTNETTVNKIFIPYSKINVSGTGVIRLKLTTTVKGTVNNTIASTRNLYMYTKGIFMGSAFKAKEHPTNGYAMGQKSILELAKGATLPTLSSYYTYAPSTMSLMEDYSKNITLSASQKGAVTYTYSTVQDIPFWNETPFILLYGYNYISGANCTITGTTVQTVVQICYDEVA